MEIDASIYDTAEYKRSRMAVMNKAHVEWFVHLLAMDAFLAKLLTHVGMEDALVGVISTISQLACTFQLLSFLIVPRIRNVKRFVLPLQTFGQLMFVSLYLVPLLEVDGNLRSILMVVAIILAYFGYMVSTVVCARWGNSFVDPHHRAEFSTTKEMISGLLGLGVSFGVGFMLDAFEADGDIRTGFLFTAIAMLVFATCELICTLMIKNEIRPAKDPDRPSTREVLKCTLGNRDFLNLTALFAAYHFGLYFTVGFFGTYQLQELGFSVGAVSVIGVAAMLVRSLLSRPIGIYSDRKSFAKGIELGMVIAVVSFLAAAFATPQVPWLIIVQAVLYQTSVAGGGSNFVNCVYSYVDGRCFSQALSVMNTIGGISSFVASILGSMLLSHIQANGNMFFGMPVYGQQVMAVISVVIIIFCLLFNRLVVQKQKIMIQ